MDHFSFILSQTSWILQVNETFLNYFLNLILSNQTKIFSTCNSYNFSSLFGVFIFTQTNKCTCFSVNTFDSLSSLSYNQSNQPDRDLKFYFIRSINSSTVHFSLCFNNQIQFFSDSLNWFRVSLDKNISSFSPRSTRSCNLYF
jgi:hypothetical protein